MLKASSKPFRISKDFVCGGFEAEVDDRYLLGIGVIVAVVESQFHSRNRFPLIPSRVQAVISRRRHRRVRFRLTELPARGA
jgi:hypothetical protein